MKTTVKALTLTLVSLALALPSSSSFAIYPIYKCTKTYTRVEGGDWVEHTYCYVIGFGGTGNWNVESEREPAVYNYEFEYIGSNGQEVSAESAINSCLNDSQARLQSCQNQSLWIPCEKSFWEPDTSPLIGHCLIGDEGDLQRICQAEHEDRSAHCNAMNEAP